MRLQLPRLGADPDAAFPPPAMALEDPPGLLAWGGDLAVPRLLAAYRQGIFPWYSHGQPILWWSPDPRMVLVAEAVHVPRRLRRSLRHCGWRLSADTAFDAVVAACAGIQRPGQGGTWITPAMARAYRELHRGGHAHSVEAWDASGGLAGGIYGVRIGRMFFGESMFSAQSGGSRVALLALCRALHAAGMPLLDCQVESAHLGALGAAPMPRAEFLRAVGSLVEAPAPPGWPARSLPASAAELA